VARNIESAVRNQPSASPYEIEALVRGLDVLKLFTQEHPRWSLSEIVDALGMTKSTAFRVLATLESSGYLERDGESRLYRPGVNVLELGFVALNGLEVRQIAHPYLERLAQELNETASLAVREGTDIVYVDRVRNRAIVGILLGIGSRAPGHCTGLGKALLADLDPAQLDEMLRKVKLERLTPRTIVDTSRLAADLKRARQRGFATNDEEFVVGLRTVAAPIRDRSGTAVAAIGMSGPVVTISRKRMLEELGPAVRGAAAEISRELGFREGP
jgi:IclR family pca regulon transcriptional regulator